MSDYLLRTKHLYKAYRRQVVLEDVQLSIKKGDIYGFIGQNGAGKSTLLRLVTGLSFPTSGTIEWFGKEARGTLTDAQKRIGAIIESPALFPNMTAQDNLEVHRLQKGIPGKECIDRTLKLVGLAHTQAKKVSNFSLGMKQRLGLGIALLSDPEFIILDEPTNGLDPTGIVELRQLLKALNREKGLTILVSSHILSELDQLATRYGIIHKGRLLEELSASELAERCRQHLRVKVDDPAKGAAVLDSALSAVDFEMMPDGAMKVYGYLDEVRKLSKALTDNGLVLEHLSVQGDSLESYFTRRIGGDRA